MKESLESDGGTNGGTNRPLREKLLSYHLAALAEPERTEVEELLLDSPAAVMELISIKRALEVEHEAAAESAGDGVIPSHGDGPSPLLRLRIRRALELEPATVRPRFPRALRWIAAAAMLAGLALAAGLREFMYEPPKPRPVSSAPSGISVDGANAEAVSLSEL